MGPSVNRPPAAPAPPPRQASHMLVDHGLFDSFDGGVTPFTQLRLNERSTESAFLGASSGGIVSGIRRLMQWKGHTGSMSIDFIMKREMKCAKPERFVVK